MARGIFQGGGLELSESNLKRRPHCTGLSLAFVLWDPVSLIVLALIVPASSPFHYQRLEQIETIAITILYRTNNSAHLSQALFSGHFSLFSGHLSLFLYFSHNVICFSHIFFR